MTSTKDTNPKDAVGVAKVPFSTLSAPVIAEVGLAMMEGALKYGRHNYRVSGVRASVYYDAALRHLSAFFEGQDIDPESGLPHITKAVAGLMVLRDSQIQGNWVDDRPPVTETGWVEELNAKAKELLDRYPNPKPAHLATDTGPRVWDDVFNIPSGTLVQQAQGQRHWLLIPTEGTGYYVTKGDKSVERTQPGWNLRPGVNVFGPFTEVLL